MPHGPEIWAVSSNETLFGRFEVISTSRRMVSGQFHPPRSTELLHEVLHGPHL